MGWRHVVPRRLDGCDSGDVLVRSPHQTHLLPCSDFIAPLIPFGLGPAASATSSTVNCGPRDHRYPRAMLFPSSRSEDVALAAADPSLLPLLNQYGVLPRHPSQLYELLLEGVVLFIILNLFIRKPRRWAPYRACS
ncbi:prolipoprotein diacylglyceryl transferase [Serratia marcescens]|uniref:Prolipoprotein diacylglyceryl transferase n=1 Tax=Serratia marcescens TaxID=615 RepID=A0A939NP06_SERMA|nr:prolipoprotein diacylglyceryl transferase [Serratia marcescens]